MSDSNCDKTDIFAQIIITQLQSVKSLLQTLSSTKTFVSPSYNPG